MQVLVQVTRSISEGPGISDLASSVLYTNVWSIRTNCIRSSGGVRVSISEGYRLTGCTLKIPKTSLLSGFSANY